MDYGTDTHMLCVYPGQHTRATFAATAVIMGAPPLPRHRGQPTAQCDIEGGGPLLPAGHVITGTVWVRGTTFSVWTPSIQACQGGPSEL